MCSESANTIDRRKGSTAYSDFFTGGKHQWQKDNYEFVMNADLNSAKETIDEMMIKMGFTMSYENAFEAMAEPAVRRAV